MSDSRVQGAYDAIPSVIKEHAGLPDSYYNLTSDQERFILEMFGTDVKTIKKELLETLDEMKGLIDEL